ncbi:MAG: energy transducer TonB [Sediminicola sp.]|tara:strand:- start:28663 stop:29496 length:834 start_codon:yes stop_codon:yes gene_type:complete
MSFLDTRHKKKSFTLTTLLLSVLLLLLFYMGLTYMDPPLENGISVNFGTMEFGSGNIQPKEPIKTAPKQEAPPKVEEVVKETPAEKIEEVLTSEDVEAPVIPPKKKAVTPAPKTETKPKEEVKKPVEKPTPSKSTSDALSSIINGPENKGTATGSEGDDNRAGDKGRPDGDPYATSYYGSAGSGSGTGGYGLNGRSLVSQGKVAQECNQEGRVVVKIVVDRSGKVISATPGVKGTTNNSACLLEPARKTAFMHKWNLDSNAPSQQIGFVVVNFKLGE